MVTLKIKDLSEQEIDRVLEMAWEDRTPFEAIEALFGLGEADIIKLMKQGMKRSSHEIWRKQANKVSDRQPHIGMSRAPQLAGGKVSKR